MRFDIEVKDVTIVVVDAMLAGAERWKCQTIERFERGDILQAKWTTCCHVIPANDQMTAWPQSREGGAKRCFGVRSFVDAPADDAVAHNHIQ